MGTKTLLSAKDTSNTGQALIYKQYYQKHYLQYNFAEKGFVVAWVDQAPSDNNGYVK